MKNMTFMYKKSGYSSATKLRFKSITYSDVEFVLVGVLTENAVIIIIKMKSISKLRIAHFE